MNYGPNSALVEEVFVFAKSGRLLVSGTVLATARSVRDLREAKRMAWEETYGPDGYTWTDIRESEVAEVNGVGYRIPDFRSIREKIRANDQVVLQLLKSQLRGEHAELLDDVFADLTNCALKRAAQGSEPGLLENIFGVYRAGGWPCGWDGDYPIGGRLAAYYAL